MARCALILCMVVLGLGKTLSAEIPPALIKRIRGAVAQVVTSERPPVTRGARGLQQWPVGVPFGTAFCVDPGGIFLTNRHIAEPLIEKPCFLELSDGKVRLRAYVVGFSEVYDIGILMTEAAPPVGTLQALALADKDELRVSDRVITAGFPGGTSKFPGDQNLDLAEGSIVRGTIAITEGEVTALQPWISKEHIVNYHSATAPGSSGSPILDYTGGVVGIHFGGSTASHGFGLGHTIRSLDRFIQSGPFLNVVVPAVPQDRRTQPIEIKAFALGVDGPMSGNKIHVALDSREGLKSVTLQRYGPGRFHISVPLVKTNEEPLYLRTTVTLSAGSMQGWILNQPATVTTTTPRFCSEFFRLERMKEGWWAWDHTDRQPYLIPQLAPKGIQLKTGDANFDVPINMVRKLKFHGPPVVPYSAVIEQNKQQLKRVDGVFQLAAPIGPKPTQGPTL